MLSEKPNNLPSSTLGEPSSFSAFGVRYPRVPVRNLFYGRFDLGAFPSPPPQSSSTENPIFPVATQWDTIGANVFSGTPPSDHAPSQHSTALFHPGRARRSPLRAGCVICLRAPVWEDSVEPGCGISAEFPPSMPEARPTGQHPPTGLPVISIPAEVGRRAHLAARVLSNRVAY